MKLGAEDKSKNGIQVFVFFSTRGQKSKYALPMCILKSDHIGPVTGRQALLLPGKVLQEHQSTQLSSGPRQDHLPQEASSDCHSLSRFRITDT